LIQPVDAVQTLFDVLLPTSS